MVSTEINGSTPSTVQLIDEDCVFKYPHIRNVLTSSEEVGSYIRASKLEGFGYHLCAVFGSQSTGKSTLLNRLFGTKFDVMDETQRKQTTKGNPGEGGF